MSQRHPLRYTYLTRHHLLPVERGGVTCPQNILRLWADKHYAWHRIFFSRTIPEILQHFDLFYHTRFEMQTQWRLIFKDRSYIECIELLERVHLIKSALKKKRQLPIN